MFHWVTGYLVAAMARGIFVTGSSFRVGGAQQGRGGWGNSAFQGFSARLGKVSFWRGDWALGYRSVELRHFPDIS